MTPQRKLRAPARSAYIDLTKRTCVPLCSWCLVTTRSQSFECGDVSIEALVEGSGPVRQIGAFVAHYNHLRYHDTIANLTSGAARLPANQFG